MNVNVVNSNKLIGLQEFLSDALGVIGDSGSSPLLVLHDNKPAFYAIPASSWNAICDQLRHDQAGGASVTAFGDGLKPSDVMQSMSVQTARHKGLEVDQPTFEKKNNFNVLAEKLLDQEWERVARGELSGGSVGIQKNRLNAHVLPFFRYVAPTQVTHVDLEGFVSRLTQHHLSSTTVSQYLVLVRKLLKLAVRQGLLKEVPEFPRIKVSTQPRAMLSVVEYGKLARTALRMSRSGVEAPPLKSTQGHRDRFWVAPRNMLLAPDMFWVIRFMVNGFIRPGDLRQLKHKHVTVVRGKTVYLRLNLPETKKHDKPMVTMQAAVQVYESLLRHSKAQGYDGAEDFVFLPAEKDRNYALAVLGFWGSVSNGSIARQGWPQWTR